MRLIMTMRFTYMLFKMKLSRNMAFRFSFFGVFFVDGTMFLVQLLMFNYIYAHVETIGGWSREQMLFFIGTFSLINALNMMLCFFGVISIPEKIRSGKLDLYITKPVNTLFYLSFENIDIGSLPLVLASGCILGYSISGMVIQFTAFKILGYIVLVLTMLVLHYDIMVIIRTITFFVIRATGLERLEGELITLCMKIPGILFKGGFKILFYLLLPYGIMATIPTQFFFEAMSLSGFVYAIAITFIFTCFTLWFFRLGIKNYKSASS